MSVPVCYMCNECRHFNDKDYPRPVCMKDKHVIKNHVNVRMPCSKPSES